MSEEPKVRGMLVQGLASFVEKRFEPGLRGRIMEAISADVRAALPTIQKNEWYPRRYALDFCRAIASVTGDDKNIELAGTHIANEATNTFMKLLIKVLTPKMFARQFPEFWKKYNSHGVITPDTSRIDERYAGFRIDGTFDYLHLLAVGFLVFVFDALGKKGVQVTHNVPPGQSNVADLLLEVTWS